MDGITTVTFDIGSTLLDASPNIDEMFFMVATDRGHDLKFEDVSQHLPTVNAFYEEEYFKDGDFWSSPQGSVEIFLDMYRYMAHLCQLEHDAENIATEINARYQYAESWLVYEDVIPCLKYLKNKKLKLGVISNWSNNLENLLRDLKLLPYFDTVIASAVVGYRKPNPVIFNLAFEALQSKAHQVIHVGDKVDADGIGARTTGCNPVIITRGLADNETDMQDGFVHISSLYQLVEML